MDKEPPKNFIRWEDVDKGPERRQNVEKACEELRRYCAERYGVTSKRREVTHG